MPAELQHVVTSLYTSHQGSPVPEGLTTGYRGQRHDQPENESCFRDVMTGGFFRSVQPFDASTIVIDLGPHFLLFSAIMRLLVEILVVATVIYFGWNKPYKEYAARANKSITSKLDGLGGTLQKHQDSSVKRY